MQCSSSFDGSKLVVKAVPIDAKCKTNVTTRELAGDEMLVVSISPAPI